MARSYPITLKGDARNQIGRVGLGRMLKIWWRSLRLIPLNPAYRRLISGALKLPMDMVRNMGYGVYAGRKPE